MKRQTLVAVVGLALGSLLAADAADVWARAGRGGSRGSRSYSAPARPSPSSPMTPSSPSRSLNQPSSPMAPQRPGFFGGGMMGGLLGGLAGFALGGLLGSMLFGGLGHGLGGFGGIGLLEILMIGGGLFFLFRFLRNRQAQSPQPAYAGPVSQTSAYGGGSERSWGTTGGSTVEMPAAPSDLERGIAHIRTMDPGFDPSAIADHTRRVYFVVQQAIGMRELAGVREYLTPEMATVLHAQCDRLRGARQTNRVERLDIRRAEVSEAWQESGQDYVTVLVAASMLDYTVDDATGAVVEGSRTAPQEIEDFWTFTRPVGNNPWKLSAIQTT
ncbi:MAG: Tim44 domain-containing protein [Candidatus Rokuibacteriota bacterium]